VFVFIALQGTFQSPYALYEQLQQQGPEDSDASHHSRSTSMTGSSSITDPVPTRIQTEADAHQTSGGPASSTNTAAAPGTAVVAAAAAAAAAAAGAVAGAAGAANAAMHKAMDPLKVPRPTFQWPRQQQKPEKQQQQPIAQPRDKGQLGAEGNSDAASGAVSAPKGAQTKLQGAWAKATAAARLPQVNRKTDGRAAAAKGTPSAPAAFAAAASNGMLSSSKADAPAERQLVGVKLLVQPHAEQPVQVVLEPATADGLLQNAGAGGGRGKSSKAAKAKAALEEGVTAVREAVRARAEKDAKTSGTSLAAGLRRPEQSAPVAAAAASTHKPGLAWLPLPQVVRDGLSRKSPMPGDTSLSPLPASAGARGSGEEESSEHWDSTWRDSTGAAVRLSSSSNSSPGGPREGQVVEVLLLVGSGVALHSTGAAAAAGSSSLGASAAAGAAPGGVGEGSISTESAIAGASRVQVFLKIHEGTSGLAAPAGGAAAAGGAGRGWQQPVRELFNLVSRTKSNTSSKQCSQEGAVGGSGSQGTGTSTSSSNATEQQAQEGAAAGSTKQQQQLEGSAATVKQQQQQDQQEDDSEGDDHWSMLKMLKKAEATGAALVNLRGHSVSSPANGPLSKASGGEHAQASAEVPVKPAAGGAGAAGHAQKGAKGLALRLLSSKHITGLQHPAAVTDPGVKSPTAAAAPAVAAAGAEAGTRATAATVYEGGSFHATSAPAAAAVGQEQVVGCQSLAASGRAVALELQAAAEAVQAAAWQGRGVLTEECEAVVGLVGAVEQLMCHGLKGGSGGGAGSSSSSVSSKGLAARIGVKIGQEGGQEGSQGGSGSAGGSWALGGWSWGAKRPNPFMVSGEVLVFEARWCLQSN
jgi:hypothetical protein